MQLEKQVRFITLILGSIAGFCDTLTYTSANGLLSAHITGNFILFASRLVRTSDLISWLRLITFPVFVLSVIAGGWISRRSAHRRWLLACEGIVLCLAGLVCMLSLLFNPIDKNLHEGITYPVALAIVFGMGLQNAYGKLFTADTYGPTTAMTGNVTQWAIDLWHLFKGIKEPDVIARAKAQSFLILSFLAGCLLGALAGRFIGLSAAVLPGLLLVILYGSPSHNRSSIGAPSIKK
jgi:uncharacterized membrane protein YoaK (UPF0700 family)